MASAATAKEYTEEETKTLKRFLKGVSRTLRVLARSYLGRAVEIIFEVGGGCYTDLKKVVIGLMRRDYDRYGHSRQLMLRKLEFLCFHELSHILFTDSEAGREICRKVVEYWKAEGAKEGLVPRPRVSLEYIAHDLINAIEDGRIENLGCIRDPRYTKIRNWTRLDEWRQHDLVEMAEEEELDVWSLIRNNILDIATCGLMARGFEDLDGFEGEKETVYALIPYIAQYVRSETMAAGEDAVLKIAEIIKEYILNYFFVDEETAEKLKELFEKMDSMSGSGEGSGESSGLSEDQEITEEILKKIAERLERDGDICKEEFDGSKGDTKGGKIIAVLTDDAPDAPEGSEDTEGVTPDGIIDLRKKPPKPSSSGGTSKAEDKDIPTYKKYADTESEDEETKEKDSSSSTGEGSKEGTTSEESEGSTEGSGTEGSEPSSSSEGDGSKATEGGSGAEDATSSKEGEDGEKSSSTEETTERLDLDGGRMDGSEDSDAEKRGFDAPDRVERTSEDGEERDSSARILARVERELADDTELLVGEKSTLRKVDDYLSELDKIEIETSRGGLDDSALEEIRKAGFPKYRADDVVFREKRYKFHSSDKEQPEQGEKRRGQRTKDRIRTMILSKSRPDRKGVYDGSLDSDALSRFIVGYGDIFKKDGRKVDPDMCCFILKDNSGSMGGTKEHQAIAACAEMEEVFKGLIPTKIAAFTYMFSSDVEEHRVIKDWSDNDTSFNYTRSYARKVHYDVGQDNYDAFSISLAAKQLQQRREKNKLLIILSDGQPACGRQDSSLESVAQAVKAARKAGVFVCNFFFGDAHFIESSWESYKLMYGSNICGCSPETLGKNLTKFVKAFVEKQLK